VEEQFSVAASEGNVRGSGTYCIADRCPTGTFEVRGTFSDPAVTLLFSYDSGPRTTFEGVLETSSRLAGTVTYSSTSGEVRSYTMVFTRKTP